MDIPDGDCPDNPFNSWGQPSRFCPLIPVQSQPGNRITILWIFLKSGFTDYFLLICILNIPLSFSPHAGESALQDNLFALRRLLYIDQECEEGSGEEEDG